MNQLTKEQRFWEQCGVEPRVRRLTDIEKRAGVRLTDPSAGYYPPIDLNNLKLYAFPLMDKVSIYIDNEYLGKKRNRVRVMYKNSFYDGENERLEDAVFFAIYQALGGK